MGVRGWSIWCYPDVPNGPHRGQPPYNELSVPLGSVCAGHLLFAAPNLLSTVSSLLPEAGGWPVWATPTGFLGPIRSPSRKSEGERGVMMVNYHPSALPTRWLPSSHVSLTRSLLLTGWCVLDGSLLQVLRNSSSPCPCELKGGDSLLLLILRCCIILCGFLKPHQ